MEVRVEVEESTLPEGSYVSVRVGDLQKQTLYSSDKIYRFPEARRFGKIDLYQRIGTCEIVWAADEPETRSCRVVGAQGVDTGTRLKVHMSRPVTGKISGDTAPLVISDGAAVRPGTVPEQPMKAKNLVNAEAKKYLAEHDIEGIFTGTMRALLKAMPAEPPSFICDHITRHFNIKTQQNAKQPEEIDTPQVAPAPVLAPAPAETCRSASLPAPATQETSVPLAASVTSSTPAGAEEAQVTTGKLHLSRSRDGKLDFGYGQAPAPAPLPFHERPSFGNRLVCPSVGQMHRRRQIPTASPAQELSRNQPATDVTPNTALDSASPNQTPSETPAKKQEEPAEMRKKEIPEELVSLRLEIGQLIASSCQDGRLQKALTEIADQGRVICLRQQARDVFISSSANGMLKEALQEVTQASAAENEQAASRPSSPLMPGKLQLSFGVASGKLGLAYEPASHDSALQQPCQQEESGKRRNSRMRTHLVGDNACETAISDSTLPLVCSSETAGKLKLSFGATGKLGLAYETASSSSTLEQAGKLQLSLGPTGKLGLAYETAPSCADTYTHVQGSGKRRNSRMRTHLVGDADEKATSDSTVPLVCSPENAGKLQLSLGATGKLGLAYDTARSDSTLQERRE